MKKKIIKLCIILPIILFLYAIGSYSFKEKIIKEKLNVWREIIKDATFIESKTTENSNFSEQKKEENYYKIPEKSLHRIMINIGSNHAASCGVENLILQLALAFILLFIIIYLYGKEKTES